MYEELKGIDYVLYINNTTYKLHMLDLINNKNETVQNTGDSWNDAAYGNCLIVLENQKATDKLYLLTQEALQSINVNPRDTEAIVVALEEKATRIIER